MALPADNERKNLGQEVQRIERAMSENQKAIANLIDAVAAGADPEMLISKQDELKAQAKGLQTRLADLKGEMEGLPDPEAIREEAQILREVIAQSHIDKDWRRESFDDISRFLHFLFGDNPKREGLGIYIAKEHGQFSATIKARLRFPNPFPIWGRDGEQDFMRWVGSEVGEPFEANHEDTLNLLRSPR
jgi:hypothetical protein